MIDPAVRKSALDQSVAQHLTGGWSLVARVSDEIAVVEWQGRARRTLTVNADGTVTHTDGAAASPRLDASAPRATSTIPPEAVASGASPFPVSVVLGTIVGLIAIAWFFLPSPDRARVTSSTRPDVESSPSRKVLRSNEPGARKIADDLVEHMQLVGLRVDCQRAEARFPISLWEAQSEVDRRMLTAAAARHCNRTSNGSFKMLHATTGKVLATIGAVDVELR